MVIYIYEQYIKYPSSRESSRGEEKGNEVKRGREEEGRKLLQGVIYPQLSITGKARAG